MHEVAAETDEKERLSDALRRLLEVAGGRPLAVSEMIEIMHGRGLHMIVILLCLPFLSPVTIPGISIPFGVAIAVCGLRIAFGHKPWLPGFILRRRVPYAALEKMAHFGSRVYEKVEKVIRPRLDFIFDAPGMIILIGVSIAIAGLFLSMPIPPPFILTNTIPGFAIIFFCLGLMERDGALIIVGYALTIVTAIYFGLIAFAGQAAIHEVWKLIFG